MPTLKVNPTHLSTSPTKILRFFPNIMMVLDCPVRLEDIDTLPDTITSIILNNVDTNFLTDKQLRFANRVVEIRGANADPGDNMDFCYFPASRNCQLSVKIIASSYQNTHSKASMFF